MEGNLASRVTFRNSSPAQHADSPRGVHACSGVADIARAGSSLAQHGPTELDGLAQLNFDDLEDTLPNRGDVESGVREDAISARGWVS